MRIAIWHNLPSGGAKRTLYEWVKGLRGRGHTLEAWCPPTADQTYLPLSDLIPEHVVPLAWQLHPSPSRVVRLVRGQWNVVKALRAMDKHCRRCATEINRGEFDLLFANGCTIFRATPIGRYVSVPRVLYLGEPYRWLYEALPRLPWLALPEAGAWWWTPGNIASHVRDEIKVHGLRVQAREELRSAQAFDRILVNSLFSRESLLRAYGLDSRICYSGVDTKRFVHRGLSREPFAVGIGAIIPEKNIRLVIEALGHVQGERPRLLWIGNVANPHYIEELQGVAHSLGVDFTPLVRVSDEELVDLLNRATMMLYAPRLEPFGLAPLEGNACGLPVIAVAEGGVRETVVDGVNGLLVESTPQAMASAIERLMSDPAYARRLGETGLRIVDERWTHAAADARVEAHLRAVLDASAKPSALVGNGMSAAASLSAGVVTD